MKRFGSNVLLCSLGLAVLGFIPTHPSSNLVMATSDDEDDGDHYIRAPGVAFSLRPDYLCVSCPNAKPNYRDLMCMLSMVAVKSSYLAPVALARVEGTEAYKRLMRTGGAQSSIEPTKYSSWCPMYDAWTPQSLQDSLGYCRGDPDVDAMKDLLGRLKAAAEAYLGHAICLVTISLPNHPYTEERLDQTINTALSNLDLTNTGALTRISSLVLLTEGWFGLDNQDEGAYEPFLFLVAESDSSGTINLDLLMLESGIVDWTRQRHNVSGSTLPSECHGDQATVVNCEELSLRRRLAIREALATFIKPPYENWDEYEVPSRLSRVVVHGDAADDEVLHEELQAQFGPGITTTPHAMYASTLGAAQNAYYRINAPYFDRNPSFWCCLRSWAKACPHGLQRYEL